MQKLRGFAKAGAGRYRGPKTGVVCAELPGRGAAHAEAAHQDAVFVDGVLALDGVQGFEEVHFAGELVGIAEAAVEVKHDGIAGRELAGSALATGDEIDLAQGLVAAVEPGVQTPAMRRGGGI